MKKDAHMNSYLRDFEGDLPDLIETIKKHSRGFRIHSYEFGTPDRDESITSYKGTGLYEQMNALLEALPLIELPDDAGLKQDIVRILYAHEQMYKDEIGHLKSDKKKIDERIEKHERDAGGAKMQISIFLDRAGLKAEQVIEARKTPLNTFPGDYDWAI